MVLGKESVGGSGGGGIFPHQSCLIRIPTICQKVKEFTTKDDRAKNMLFLLGVEWEGGGGI